MEEKIPLTENICICIGYVIIHTTKCARGKKSMYGHDDLDIYNQPSKTSPE